MGLDAQLQIDLLYHLQNYTIEWVLFENLDKTMKKASKMCKLGCTKVSTSVMYGYGNLFGF